MARQETNWGYIDWLEPDCGPGRLSLNTGIVTIAPHAHMSAHIHFTEQVLYTLGGTGYSLVDGEKVDMSESGLLLQWRPGVIHEMFNLGDTPFRHLMVSCPDLFGADSLPDRSSSGQRLREQEADEYLAAAIRGTRSQFLDMLHYSYSVFNSRGELITRSRVFPDYCRKHCGEKLESNSAPCMCQKLHRPFFEEGGFQCANGMQVIYAPLLFQGSFLGYIQGGFFCTASEPDPQGELYVTPQSSIQGASHLVRRIARAVSEYCQFYRFHQELIRRDEELAAQEQDRARLVQNLRTVESSLTDMRISNHFLFNTLNQMASMALDGGLVPLYQSILDLSKLFHYTLRNNSRFVSLDKELDYVRAYIKLQKLRYGGDLQLELREEARTEDWVVPFNFLLPVVENCFTHGFTDCPVKRLSLHVLEKPEGLSITVGNNGPAISHAGLRSMEISMKSGSVHGLSMLYQKLRSVYGMDFRLELRSEPGEGTEVCIFLPAGTQGERVISYDSCGNL